MSLVTPMHLIVAKANRHGPLDSLKKPILCLYSSILQLFVQYNTALRGLVANKNVKPIFLLEIQRILINDFSVTTEINRKTCQGGIYSTFPLYSTLPLLYSTILFYGSILYCIFHSPYCHYLL